MTVTGKDTQVGFAVETTYGTRVAPTEFLRHRSVSLSKQRALIDDEAILAGRLTRDTDQTCEGDITVDGDLSLPLFRGTGLRSILKAMMGAESGAGTAVDPYLYNPTSPAAGLDSLTVQVGYGGTGGTVHPVDYLGCVISSWSIAAQQGAKATLDLSLVGRDAVDDQTLATASYSRPRTYSFAHASATFGGLARKVKSLTLSGDNGLETSRRFIGSQLIEKPIASDLRTYSAELTCEFEDLDDLSNTYLGGIASTVAVVATFTDSTDILTVTMNGFLDATPLPDVNTRGPLEYTLMLDARGDGTDVSAVQIQQNTA